MKNKINYKKRQLFLLGMVIGISLMLIAVAVVESNEPEIQEPIIKELQIDYLEIQINGTNFTMRNFSMDYDKVSLDSLIFQMDDLK